MKPFFHIALVGVLGLLVISCNQPFEPDGPANSKLVVYSILNGASSTQFVRLSGAYATAPAPSLRGASVWMTYDGKTKQFRDTTVSTVDASGAPVNIPVFVAYQMPITGGSKYTLHVTDPSGLSADVRSTALQPPSFTINNAKVLSRSVRSQIILNTTFGSFDGAFVMHFYLDFYAFVNGGWELHREEVPSRSYEETDGTTVKVYPSLDLVSTYSASRTTVPIPFDTLQYDQTRSEIITRYAAAPVVWLRATFVLSQIDDVLYNYYYVNNGPRDNSTIRMDQPDYTNIPNGLGVFGSSVMVTMSYPLTN
jgi:hypothetical protein